MKKVLIVLFIALSFTPLFATTLQVEGPVISIKSETFEFKAIQYSFDATEILDKICGIWFGAYTVYEIADSDSYYLKYNRELKNFVELEDCLKSKITHDLTIKLLTKIAEYEKSSIITKETAENFLKKVVNIKLKDNAPIITQSEINQINNQKIAIEQKKVKDSEKERLRVEDELNRIIKDGRYRVQQKRILEPIEF